METKTVRLALGHYTPKFLHAIVKATSLVLQLNATKYINIFCLYFANSMAWKDTGFSIRAVFQLSIFKFQNIQGENFKVLKLSYTNS